MRKVFFIKVMGVVFALLCYAGSFAQWQSDVRLTNDTGDCYVSLNGSRCVAISGSTLHIVWSDERDGNREIYYKRSPDAGTSWRTDTRFTNNPLSSWRPSIASYGPVIHVVWCEEAPGNFEIYYKRSTDNGTNWGPNIRLTFDSLRSWAPSMALYGNILHVVWAETRDGNEEVYYKRSTDGGISWGTDTRLTFDSSGTFYPSVAVSGNTVHTVWYDFRTGHRAVFYKRSTDGGTSWGPETQITFSLAESYNPTVGVSGQIVHVAWHDTREGAEEIYYKRSTDGGSNWGSDVRITNNPGISWYPSMAVSGPAVHLAWHDNTDGNYEIYYARSTDAGVNWQANTRLTNNIADSYRPSVGAADSMVHVIWNDSRDGNFEMYYKRNPTGNPIGINNNGSVTPSGFSLSQNYPNPFNPVTKIRFSIANSSPLSPLQRGTTSITVYDVTGREVRTLVNERLEPGMYEVTFDGNGLASGVYFYELRAEGYRETKRMVLIR